MPTQTHYNTCTLLRGYCTEKIFNHLFLSRYNLVLVRAVLCDQHRPSLSHEHHYLKSTSPIIYSYYKDTERGKIYDTNPNHNPFLCKSWSQIIQKFYSYIKLRVNLYNSSSSNRTKKKRVIQNTMSTITVFTPHTHLDSVYSNRGTRLYAITFHGTLHLFIPSWRTWPFLPLKKPWIHKYNCS